MLTNMLPSRDIKTQGIVLKRVNYGEADRILNIITPEGKLAVIARGVRKPRSKLAGGVEMFSVSDLQIHCGRSEMGILTGAKMIQHYGGIAKDLTRMQLAGEMLKLVNRVTEAVEGGAFFEILKAGLSGLDDGSPLELLEAWFRLNLMRVSGEELNLYRDRDGRKLLAGERYDWQASEEVFLKSSHGMYGENEIKLLRIMVTQKFETVKRVRVNDEMISKTLAIARCR